VEAELKVRTDIMNVTSIVSEADKKGDILTINDKFIEVSKYSRNELIGGRTTPRGTPTCPRRCSSRCGPPSAAARCSAA
jgi:methyl-accepting chemotaxis protein